MYIYYPILIIFSMGKRRYHQIEKSEEKPVRNETESEKEGEDFSKREKSKSREKVTYIKEKEENYKMITAMKKWSSKTKGQTSKS